MFPIINLSVKFCWGWLQRFHHQRRLSFSPIHTRTVRTARPRARYNIKNPSKIHLNLKSRKISSVHWFSRGRRILVVFCIEHCSHTAVPCAKFLKDLSTKVDAMGEWDFARFRSKRISDGLYILLRVSKIRKLSLIYLIPDQMFNCKIWNIMRLEEWMFIFFTFCGQFWLATVDMAVKSESDLER